MIDTKPEESRAVDLARNVSRQFRNPNICVVGRKC